jgi:hypothetical protein
LAWMKFGAGGAGSLSGQKPPGMPAEAAAQMQQYMGAAGKTAPPTRPGGLGSAPMPMMGNAPGMGGR